MSEAIRPYRIEVEDAALDDLRARLSRTRFPEAETVDDWSQGIPLAYVRELCAYWRLSYDWRRTEARLNALKTLSDDVDRKLKEQVGRRTDVDETRREGLSSQIAAADGPLDRPVRKRHRRRRPRDCSVTAPD